MEDSFRGSDASEFDNTASRVPFDGTSFES
jgi:hypothetical protein